MILSKRNFLIGATASLGIIAVPAIVRCESLMAIKAIENTRYLTFLEIIYPGIRKVLCCIQKMNGVMIREAKS